MEAVVLSWDPTVGTPPLVSPLPLVPGDTHGDGGCILQRRSKRSCYCFVSEIGTVPRGRLSTGLSGQPRVGPSPFLSGRWKKH